MVKFGGELFSVSEQDLIHNTRVLVAVVSSRDWFVDNSVLTKKNFYENHIFFEVKIHIYKHAPRNGILFRKIITVQSRKVTKTLHLLDNKSRNPRREKFSSPGIDACGTSASFIILRTKPNVKVLKYLLASVRRRYKNNDGRNWSPT